jgi:branched-chain amino acid transport system permease protein
MEPSAQAAAALQTRRTRAPSRHLLPGLIFGLLLLAPVAAAFGAEGYLLSLLTRVMIFAIAAVALDLILGYGALVSFGHAAFLGIGAYAAGILQSHGIDDLALHLGAALAVAAIFALLTGAVSLRTKGVYFIMITLAFGQMLFFLATSLAAYGGDDGLTMANRSRVFGSDLIENDRAFYILVLALLVGVYVLCRALVASRFGRVLRGAKDNPVRMEAIGFHPFRHQLAAYVISGMIASVAGVLLANQAEFVSPAYMTWQRSGELIIMVVLGGLGSLHGAILGAAALLLAEEWLSGFTTHWKMILGPLLILVVLFGRGGIMGLLRRAGLGGDP